MTGPNPTPNPLIRLAALRAALAFSRILADPTEIARLVREIDALERRP